MSMYQKPKLSCFFMLLAILITSPLFAEETLPQTENSAVIITYHRFGEGKYPLTNIKIAQFEEHLKILKKGQYTVLPLTEIIEKLQNKDGVPPKTIGIAIEDGYQSFYENGWPKLKQANYPFTLFLNTSELDKENKNFLSWDQVREMMASGLASIGNHTHTHAHAIKTPPKTFKKDVKQSEKRIKKELGVKTSLFSHPYGEYTLQTHEIIKDMGFKAALATQSGPIHSNSDFIAAPRFELSERFGSSKRFAEIIKSKPLAVSDVTPKAIISRQNPPTLEFTVDESMGSLDKLACYLSGTSLRLKLTEIEKRQRRFSVTPPPIKSKVRKLKINCTLPSPEKGRWHWFSKVFFVVS